MTSKTRRRLVVCFVALALTLPIEAVLLRALSTSTQQAARDWASSLSANQAQAYADSIQTLPFEYRRAVMRVLSPAQRANVWRSHILDYISQNAGLDESTQALLHNAASLATPQAFSNPSAEAQAAMTIIAEQVSVVLGRDEAEYLLYRLGPKDLTVASGLPVGERLAEFVRGTFIVQAAIEDCDCSTSFGCDAPNHCDGNQTCIRDEEYPMCGWWWNQECNGLCMIGIG